MFHGCIVNALVHVWCMCYLHTTRHWLDLYWTILDGMSFITLSSISWEDTNISFIGSRFVFCGRHATLILYRLQSCFAEREVTYNKKALATWIRYGSSLALLKVSFFGAPYIKAFKLWWITSSGLLKQLPISYSERPLIMVATRTGRTQESTQSLPESFPAGLWSKKFLVAVYSCKEPWRSISISPGLGIARWC